MHSGYKLNLEWIPSAYSKGIDTKGKDDKPGIRADAGQEVAPAKVRLKGIYKRGAKKPSHY
jgi:hypothetical protein